MSKSQGKGSGKKRTDITDYTSLDYVALVEVVRKSRDDRKVNAAFDEIERRMRTKIKQISYRFKIPGSERSDVYQEALCALRLKAIKDYDKDRGNGSGPYPFDKFAVLCIKRHLMTKLKACFQHRKIPWASMVPLHQERSDSSGDTMFLADIVACTAGNILDDIAKSEYAKTILRKIYSELSEFEREVFILFLQRHSYDNIRDRINLKLGKKEQIKVKSVDNAISRIKKKAKEIRTLVDRKSGGPDGRGYPKESNGEEANGTE